MANYGAIFRSGIGITTNIQMPRKIDQSEQSYLKLSLKPANQVYNATEWRFFILRMLKYDKSLLLTSANLHDIGQFTCLLAYM